MTIRFVGAAVALAALLTAACSPPNEKPSTGPSSSTLRPATSEPTTTMPHQFSPTEPKFSVPDPNTPHLG